MTTDESNKENTEESFGRYDKKVSNLLYRTRSLAHSAVTRKLEGRA